MIPQHFPKLHPGAVLDIAKGMRELLNGPTGSADCGKIDAMIVSLLRSAGFSEDEIN